MSASLGGASLGAWRTVSTGVLLGSAAVLLFALVDATGSQRLAFDLREVYLPAARSVWDTGSPYGAAAPFPYAYPPQLAIALVPLTAVSADAAAFAGFLVVLAALFGALALVGVRDVRCYAAVLIWAPAWNALEMANVSALLALALGLAWRYRDMTWRPSIALGLAISTKLFLWPLLAWLAAMRRYRTATLAVAVGIGVTFAAWAAIGFAGLTSYPALLARFDKEWSGQSYSIFGIAAALGLEPAIGRALTLSVGVALLAACVSLGRKADDARSFMCAVAAALVLTPVIWLHYLVLLPVPLAIARPRFSLIWLVPIVLWVCSPRSDDGVALAILPLAVAAAVFCAALVRPMKVRLAEQASA